jgi:hypothetical protein
MRNVEFESEDEASDLSKSEINSERILKRIHIHDPDAGGIFSLSTGGMGTGKTAVLLSFMDYTIRNYPEEKIFFSNCFNSPLQFVKIGEGRFNIMVKENSGITFHDRNNKLKQIFPEVTTFKDNVDLYEKAIPGKCNAVFFPNRVLDWISFIHALRSIGQWTHIYIDELSEIAPAFTSGKQWKKIRDFANDLKEVRKCMLNVHTNTQSISDIDFRCRSKVMCKIFLPGAQADTHSRIDQTAIDNLNEDPVHGNEAYIEMAGKFGRTVFEDIYKPNSKILWEARSNDN